MSKPSYIVFKGIAPMRFPGMVWQILRQDEPHHSSTHIGRFPTKREAMQCARLLAGWQGRFAFTTDVTTYPW